MEPKEIKQVIECILFVSDKPVSLGTMQGLLEEAERRTLLEVLDELKAEYDQQGRAFQLVEIAEGYQLVTRIQFAPWIRKMYKTRTTNKLSKAALETLAIIAYRQPITKAEIEDIRGVSADGMVSTMMERKFIRVVGRKEVVGRPLLYGTTKEFLHYFGLKDLTDMPELKDLQDILKQEDLGKDWELNQHGDLVAKIHGSDDDDAEQRNGQETDQDEGSDKVNGNETTEDEAAAGQADDQPGAQAHRQDLSDEQHAGPEPENNDSQDAAQNDFNDGNEDDDKMDEDDELENDDENSEEDEQEDNGLSENDTPSTQAQESPVSDADERSVSES